MHVAKPLSGTGPAQDLWVHAGAETARDILVIIALGKVIFRVHFRVSFRINFRVNFVIGGKENLKNMFFSKEIRPNGVDFLNPQVEKPLTPIFEPNRS